jgi:uncharacterized protein (DUF58 family)
MTIKRWFRRTFEFWLKKRIPPQQQHTLGLRSIFIFPSFFGFAYLLVSGFLFLLGTNYQNNLILLMTYGLIGFFVTSILFSYANLSGLTLKGGHTSPVYANDITQIPIYLSDCLDRNTLTFSFNQQRQSILELAAEQDKVLVPFKAKTRGLINPQRVMLKSYFPLGLLRCWSHVDLAIEVLVYPATIEAYIPLLQLDDLAEDLQHRNPEQDDFVGIKEYVQGESMSRISWKHVARNQQKLVSKEFNSNEGEPQWLSINQVHDSDTEVKLSKLAHAVDYYSSQHALFGLELNKTRIQPSQGEEHRLACLEALALW